MSFRTLRFAGAVFFVFLAVAALYWFSLDKITFSINGKTFSARLHGETVGDAIQMADVLVDSADIVEPAMSTPLSDGMTINIKKAEQVAVEADGQILRVYTHATDPLIILSEANIQLGENDEVIVDGIPINQHTITQRPPRVLRVLRAMVVTIEDNNTSITVSTTAQTVGGALTNANLSLFVADKVIPPLDAPLTEGMRVQINRSRPVTVRIDGRVIITRTTAETVQEALVELGIALSGLDYVIPNETAPFAAEIRVVRVTETFEIIEEALPYRTILRPDGNLPLDVRATLQPGEQGVFRRRYRTRLEDGQMISHVQLDSWIEKHPIDEIVVYGTQIQIRTRPTEIGQIEYWRVLTMNVGAYSPALAGKNMTSTGEILRKGVVAVDPAVIPLGSQVYIEGYGQAVAADVLPEASGLSIMLGYEDDHIQPWSGEVEVYVLTPPPQVIPYLLQESP